MPRNRKRGSFVIRRSRNLSSDESDEKMSHNRKRSKNSIGNYEVKDILSCRVQKQHNMEFEVSWIGYSDRTWEPFDNLSLNITFQQYIKEKFDENETDIFVNLANIKEKLKSKIRNTLKSQLKFITMLDIYPFDPFEFKVTQVAYHLITTRSETFTQYLEHMVFKNYFFKLDEVQRIKHDKFIASIQKKDNIKFTIENDIDFDDPPSMFNYITENFLADQLNETVIETDNFLSDYKGCRCEGGKCSKESECCPKLLKKPFAYKYDSKNNPILRSTYEEIIECNDMCSCSPDCINRVSQQRNNVPLCLFKTETRGWGLKALTNIKKGTYILEYVGEILGNHEASKREQSEYLFDLNLDRKSHGFYTIDAFRYGNLGRFVNHSCDPNCKIWYINNCLQNPQNQKLCIFADKFIAKDEEITIDYSPRSSIPTTERSNSSNTIICLCGSEACRGSIY